MTTTLNTSRSENTMVFVSKARVSACMYILVYNAFKKNCSANLVSNSTKYLKKTFINLYYLKHIQTPKYSLQTNRKKVS
jgi:hypothetical protein